MARSGQFDELAIASTACTRRKRAASIGIASTRIPQYSRPMRGYDARIRRSLSKIALAAWLVAGIASPAQAEVPPRTVVSLDEFGDPAFNGSGSAITSDGRLLVFGRAAPNLPRGDAESDCGLSYLRDLETGSIRIVSRIDAGVVCAGGLAISNDGRLVLLNSNDESMPGPVGALFIRDLERGRTIAVSRDPTGSIVTLDSGFGVMSGNGRFVAFIASGRLYLRNLRTGITRELPVDSNGDPIPAELGVSRSRTTAATC